MPNRCNRSVINAWKSRIWPFQPSTDDTWSHGSNTNQPHSRTACLILWFMRHHLQTPECPNGKCSFHQGFSLFGASSQFVSDPPPDCASAMPVTTSWRRSLSWAQIICMKRTPRWNNCFINATSCPILLSCRTLVLPTFQFCILSQESETTRVIMKIFRDKCWVLWLNTACALGMNVIKFKNGEMCCVLLHQKTHLFEWFAAALHRRLSVWWPRAAPPDQISE